MSLDKRLIKIEAEFLRSHEGRKLMASKWDSGNISKEDISALLTSNHNVFDLFTIKHLFDKEILTLEDFISCDIDEGYIDLLDEDEPKDPTAGSDFKQIASIDPGVTEVYFWGVPSSGKTCALGAVMSVANNGNDQMIQKPCQGGDYMTRLASIFKNDGCYTFLPKGTEVMNTYEMRFSLIREKKEHPLALIDLSGELFTCLYKTYTNTELSEEQNEAFKTLYNILVEHPSENHKIHFFVIEYGSEKKEFDGLAQDAYLQRAAEYLDQIHVFDDYTDAIYIIITKADLAEEFKSDEEILMNHFKNYMSRNYHGFYNTLRGMCNRHSINGGSLEFIPFSIGDVCFRRLCCFDSTYASGILDYIVERSFYVERNIFGKITKVLRK